MNFKWGRVDRLVVSLLLSWAPFFHFSSVQFSSVTQSYPTLCYPRDCSTPGLPVHHQLLESEVAQLCPTLCDPMDCSLPGCSVHGIFQAIVLEWIAISFSSGSSRPRDRTWVSRIVHRCLTVWETRELHAKMWNHEVSFVSDIFSYFFISFAFFKS